MFVDHYCIEANTNFKAWGLNDDGDFLYYIFVVFCAEQVMRDFWTISLVGIFC